MIGGITFESLKTMTLQSMSMRTHDGLKSRMLEEGLNATKGIVYFFSASYSLLPPPSGTT